MVDRYQRDYDELTLAPGASWSEVQRRYRQLVQTWHPDRYQGYDNKNAEIRFIRITRSYHRLRSHYRQNGSLPKPTVTRAVAAQAEPDAERITVPAPSAPNYRQRPLRLSPGQTQVVLILLGGLLLIFLLFSMDQHNTQQYTDDALMLKAQAEQPSATADQPTALPSMLPGTRRQPTL